MDQDTFKEKEKYLELSKAHNKLKINHKRFVKDFGAMQIDNVDLKRVLGSVLSLLPHDNSYYKRGVIDEAKEVLVRCSQNKTRRIKRADTSEK